ncbi:L-ascorbate oxidase [Puccinia sorghi]|uniref:L-ascorbate oxidase n=1 Tax=Puccinia sorghi TaxID=27349 RepID=A0A0L6VQW9_9BASI|nr:L-ascorbate oxidase [Puccinia sorghi]
MKTIHQELLLTIATPLPPILIFWPMVNFEPLDPLEVAPKAGEVTRRITITGQQRKTPDGHINWFINGQKWVETRPEVPFLVKAYTTNLKPNYEVAEKNNGFDDKLEAYPVKLDDVVEFVIFNQASTMGVTEAHPWQ